MKALNEARLEANIQLKGKGIMKKWASPCAIGKYTFKNHNHKTNEHNK